MARKKKTETTEQVSQVLEPKKAENVAPIVAPDEQVKLLEQRIAELTDDNKVLKKQNAGLRGEINKQKQIIQALRQQHQDLCQDYKDLDAIGKRMADELGYYKHLCARPWYKRIFG